jgi:Na+/H+ antiporter NhaC
MNRLDGYFSRVTTELTSLRIDESGFYGDVEKRKMKIKELIVPLKNRKTKLVISTLLLILTAAPVLAETPKNYEIFSFWTLLPPVLAIALAFLTKNVIISLFIGVFSGTFMLELKGAGIFSAIVMGFLNIVQKILNSLADPWNAGIILQCLAIGGLVALISKMGGARAIAEKLAKRAKSPVSAQIMTWLMGLLIFFDDYANALIVGPIMRPVADKMKISREKLAFVIDATAAPIAGIALISTWVGYEVGLINDAYAKIGVDINAYGAFVQTIPYRFYNILILFFIVISAVTSRDFGSMHKAQVRAYKENKPFRDGARPMISAESTGLEPEEDTKLSIWNAIIPIGVLILAAFAGFYYNGYTGISGGEDAALKLLIADSPASFAAIRECFGASDASIVLFQAAVLACLVAMIMAITRKIMTIEESVSVWLQGVKSLVITAVILLLAWSLSSVIKELGTADYLVQVLQGNLPAFFIPSLIFIMGALISFATGTSYGTMGILMPLAVPLAHNLAGGDPQMVIISASAVLTGAIFGDHCSPISDTTILSSTGSACDHIDHTRTQLPYALTTAAVTVLLGYLPVSLGLSVWIAMPIAMIAIAAVIFIFGKKPDAEIAQ